MKNVELTDAEVDVFRKQTRGCAKLIHFNNAGASLPPDVVVDAVVDYLKDEAEHGGYETEARRKRQLDDVYTLIAELINADIDEVAIFENASTAWVTAFKGLSFEEGDEIIASEMEYVSNLIGMIDIQKKQGVRVKVVSNDEKGNFNLSQLEKSISARTKLIAVTHMASSGGGVIPIEEIGAIAERNQILYMVDACQSAGQIPLDVRRIKCDILSATGRKYLRAPRGTGFLFVRKRIQDQIAPIILDQHAATNIGLDGYTLRPDARRYELYEKNRALTLGLGKAIEYALGIGLDRIWERVRFLALNMRNELNSIPGVVVHDQGEVKCGIVTFSVDGLESMVVKTKLGELGINVTVGTAPATLIYMQKRGLANIVRASLHYYNTEEEVKVVCAEIRRMISI